MIFKKENASWIYLTLGLLLIVPPTFALYLYWDFFINLIFPFIYILCFFGLIYFFGVIYIVESIHCFKATRDNKYHEPHLITCIFSIFLIIMLIGSSMFYLIYLGNIQKNHGPYLSWTSDSSTTMTITWDTYISEENPTFKWGKKQSDLRFTAKVTGNNHHHTVTLTGLKPDTTYYYKIPDFHEKITSFNTGPEEGSRSPFNFIFYGDTREDEPTDSEPHHEENVEAILDEKDTKFILQAGDIANKHSENFLEQWDYNFQVIKKISKNIPYMSVAGNHDWWSEYELKSRDSGQEFLSFYEFPTNGPDKDGASYYFSYGNAFFLAIGYDQQELASPEHYNAEYVKWVETQLHNAKTSGLYDWIFVIHHKPAFSIKVGAKLNNTNIRYWHPIFMELGVDFVLNGHNHHYERITMGYTQEDIGIHNITYVVSGAGGGGGKIHKTRKETFSSKSDPEGNLEYYGKTNTALEDYHYVRFSINGKSITLSAITDKRVKFDSYTISK